MTSAECRQVTWSSQAKKVRLYHPILSVFVYLLVARFAAGQTVSLQDYSLVNCDKSLCQSQKCSNLTKSVVFRRLVVLLLLLKGTNKTQQQGIFLRGILSPQSKTGVKACGSPELLSQRGIALTSQTFPLDYRKYASCCWDLKCSVCTASTVAANSQVKLLCFPAAGLQCQQLLGWGTLVTRSCVLPGETKEFSSQDVICISSVDVRG